MLQANDSEDFYVSFAALQMSLCKCLLCAYIITFYTLPLREMLEYKVTSQCLIRQAAVKFAQTVRDIR